jgi:hypothetical protein
MSHQHVQNEHRTEHKAYYATQRHYLATNYDRIYFKILRKRASVKHSFFTLLNTILREIFTRTNALFRHLLYRDINIDFIKEGVCKCAYECGWVSLGMDER